MTPSELRTRLALMVITEPNARIGVLPAVAAAIQGGAGSVQLRWKEGSTRDLLELARELRALTRARGALLIVNDRVDVALAASADGAHLGDDDLPIEIARRLAGPGFLMGRSVDNAEEAATAERQGADYVGLGPIFSTGSKSGLGAPIGTEGIASVRRHVRLPIVAVGGIDAERADRVAAAGADGVAVIGAIMGAPDPERATREILEAILRGRSSRSG